MMLHDRARLVQELLTMQRPLELVAGDLYGFPVDCEPGDVQTLTRTQASRLLRSFIEHAIPLDDFKYWATLVERRTDVAYEDDSATLKEMVFVLAHPGVNRPLDAGRARTWIDGLEAEARAAGRPIPTDTP